VIEKGNQRSGLETSGVVSRLLTSSGFHPRGIKVMLEGGVVGRVNRIDSKTQHPTTVNCETCGSSTGCEEDTDNPGVFYCGNCWEEYEGATAPEATQTSVTHHPTTSSQQYFDSLGTSDVVVKENFLSTSESSSLFDILATKISGGSGGGSRRRGKRWEKGHFDGVIFNYKEVELLPTEDSSDNLLLETTSKVHALLRSYLNDVGREFLPPHCIVLRGMSSTEGGHIAPHVDSVKFSGDVVCGISLGAPRTMRLRPADPETGGVLRVEGEGEVDNEGGYIDMTLDVGSLYVLGGEGRYNWTHEILQEAGEGGERISVIFRDEKQAD